MRYHLRLMKSKVTQFKIGFLQHVPYRQLLLLSFESDCACLLARCRVPYPTSLTDYSLRAARLPIPPRSWPRRPCRTSWPLRLLPSCFSIQLRFDEKVKLEKRIPCQRGLPCLAWIHSSPQLMDMDSDTPAAMATLAQSVGHNLQ